MKDLTPNKSDLDPIEIASRDEIMALQLTRMKTTLKHAYDNVPMYKDRFDAAGVHPDDLTCLSDLAKFPFTYKDDLRANYPFGLSAVPREELVRIHASSGTTGKPTVVVYTQNDIDVWAEVVARSLRASGLKRGDTVHNGFTTRFVVIVYRNFCSDIFFCDSKFLFNAEFYGKSVCIPARFSFYLKAFKCFIATKNILN